MSQEVTGGCRQMGIGVGHRTCRLQGQMRSQMGGGAACRSFSFWPVTGAELGRSSQGLANK